MASVSAVTATRGRVGSPAAAATAVKAELVHAQVRPDQVGAGVGQPGQVEGRLDGAVLARAAVAAVHHHVDGAAALCLRRKPPSGPAAKTSGVAPRGHPLGEGDRLQTRVDGEELAGLRPVEGGDLLDRLGQGPGGLQAGEDADVVLGRRPAEQHGGAKVGGDGHGPAMLRQARRLAGEGTGKRGKAHG